MPPDNEDDYSAQQRRGAAPPPKEMGERLARVETLGFVIEQDQDNIRRDARQDRNRTQELTNAVRDLKGDMERMAKVSTENGVKLDELADVGRWFKDNKDALELFVHYRRTAPGKVGPFVISVAVALVGFWQWISSHMVMK